MAQTPEDKTCKIASQRSGVLVAIIAAVLAGAPFYGKSLLRSRMPPVWHPSIVDRSDYIKRYLDQQREEAFVRAMSVATQLDVESGRGLPKMVARYRDAVTTLNLLDLKKVEGLNAAREEEEGKSRRFEENQTARAMADRRAQHLNSTMMVWFTLAGAIFLLLVLRSQTLPKWAEQISMVAAGAIIASWFPL